jgi:hypothetical protein
MISETRRRLKEWGSWARDGSPSISSMFRLIHNGGRGAQDLREMPPHIQEIDHLVCTAPKDIRIMLIKFYGSVGSYYEKATALGLDKRTFKRRIDRADYWVHSQLDRIPTNHDDVARQRVRVYRTADAR